MHKIKMIGLDLDGTLLTSDKRLLPFTRQVLTEAIERGILVLMATGRPYTGIPEELRNLSGMRYALTSNGARILDTQTGKVLIEHLLPLKSAKKALEILRKYDTLQEVYFEGQGYAEAKKLDQISRYHHNPHMWEYVRSSRKAVPSLSELIDRENQDMDKVQALFADMGELGQAWKELEQYEDLVLVSSLGYNIEINAVGVDKGTGLMELGELLGIRPEEIMACGDGDNDIQMLERSGIGVAMGNAEEKVKAAADYVAETNDEEGAAKAIIKYAFCQSMD
jgi:hypothetical protein